MCKSDLLGFQYFIKNKQNENEFSSTISNVVKLTSNTQKYTENISLSRKQ